jgi:asparagine synthase (glutamine-hydrolysing)
MTGILAHRGPDDAGFYHDNHVGLGHRRLSIVDLSTGGQPMTNEDGALHLIYNGEIFNHADLRPALERAGHKYTTRSDTETILHAYEEYGAACVTHFRGMFAFALWDSRQRRLFCARDRLGIKPFYYYLDGNVFVFASEIKALLCHPEVRTGIDESKLPEYLAFGYLSGDRTMFSGIRKLMPGHTLELSIAGGKLSGEPLRYWSVPSPESSGEARRDEDWIEECSRRLEETVRMRLMSDVPLGMFLSGGVDSSAIAALIKRMTSGPVKTFSVGYPESAYSELGYARQVAQAIRTDHHEVVLSRQEFFEALPDLVWHEDEPIAWPSSVSLYFVSRLAATQVKVVLTGEGSDEMFGGYSRYGHYLNSLRWMRAYGRIPASWRGAIRRAIGSSRLLSADLRRKLGHTILGREPSLESLYLDNFYCAFTGREAGALTGGGDDAYGGFRRYWDQDPAAPDSLARLLRTDQQTYLVELLMKQDQMSMASSIESRVPFLDHTFVEFAASVPAGLKIRNGEAKYILKRAVERLLPREIVYRRKMGFPTPLRTWLTGPQAEPLLASLMRKEGLLASCLDLKAVGALLDRHRCGAEDGTDRIWRLLNLQTWGDVFWNNGRRRASPGAGRRTVRA